MLTQATNNVDLQTNVKELQQEIRTGLLATDRKADEANETAKKAWKEAITANGRIDALIASGTPTPMRRLTYHDIIETKPSAGTVVPAQVVETDTEQGKRSCNFFLFHLAIIQPASQPTEHDNFFFPSLHLYIMKHR